MIRSQLVSALEFFLGDTSRSLCPAPLTIDTSTGQINRNPENQIDREFVARYDLVVIARDLGTQPLNSTVDVRIDILVSSCCSLHVLMCRLIC